MFFHSSAHQPTSSRRLVERAKHWLSASENRLLLLLLVLAAVPLCYELGRNPVQLWDESRLAVNAAEMSRNNNWLITYFENKPDHWNTKPPLLIWLQALSFKAFGYSTWALRLPTALATLATVAVLFRFAARDLRLPLAGFFAGLILVSSIGYVRLHVARTADYDALLTFWQVIVWVSLFRYLEAGRTSALFWLTAGLTAAVLTKSVAGLLALPGLLLYTTLRGKLLWLLRPRQPYLAAGIFLLVTGGYFGARELADPGYWQAVQANDLGGRYLTEQQIHGHPWNYYLLRLRNGLFDPWLWLVLPSLLLLLAQPVRQLRWAASLLLCFVSGWLVVISTAASKLEWYDAPIYPALALLVGLGLALVMKATVATHLPGITQRTSHLVNVLAVLILFSPPYKTVIDRIVAERHSDFGVGSDSYLGRYINSILKKQPQLNSVVALYNGGYNATLTFYRFVYEQQQKELIGYPGAAVRDLRVGTTTLVCNPEYRARLDSVFQVMELDREDPCQTLLLTKRKP